MRCSWSAGLGLLDLTLLGSCSTSSHVNTKVREMHCVPVLYWIWLKLEARLLELTLVNSHLECNTTHFDKTYFWRSQYLHLNGGLLPVVVLASEVRDEQNSKGLIILQTFRSSSKSLSVIIVCKCSFKVIVFYFRFYDKPLDFCHKHFLSNTFAVSNNNMLTKMTLWH